MHGNDRIGSKIGLGVGRLPLAQVHRKGDDAVLDATDAGRERLVVGVDRELVLLCVEVLLDAIGVLGGPFVGLAIVDEVVVFEARRRDCRQTKIRVGTRANSLFGSEGHSIRGPCGPRLITCYLNCYKVKNNELIDPWGQY